MEKLTQAGLWILAVAVAMGGFGLTAMAVLDAMEFLGGDLTGYAYLSDGEEIAYGVTSIGGALFIAAMTVGALVGLEAFRRYLKTEVFGK